MMVFMAPEVYLNRRVRHCRFARGWFALIFGCLCPGHEDICNILQWWFWTICRINLLWDTMQVSPEHLSATPERPKQAKHLVGTAGGVNDALKLLLEEAGLSDHRTVERLRGELYISRRLFQGRCYNALRKTCCLIGFATWSVACSSIWRSIRPNEMDSLNRYICWDFLHGCFRK